ncbi:Uncharacterized protein FWK35_00020842 [Aphis craccivora]|uniref:Uncharacterized protein n=1 Tax=Aphis craccivora TaxID=307492 RepID=A0A6G0WU06_APHCR|nr:Uncharacterized protein FWK35_00020842 [Aphis craccivora]
MTRVFEHETGRIAYGPTTTERCGRGFESSSSQFRVQPALSPLFDRAQSPITDVSMSGSCGGRHQAINTSAEHKIESVYSTELFCSKTHPGQTSTDLLFIALSTYYNYFSSPEQYNNVQA